MKKKRNACTSVILTILIVLCCNALAFAMSDWIAEAVFSCCECVADGANTAINWTSESLISESNEIDEELYGDYPEGYDQIAMGEVDPWDAYRAQQAEEMDRAMAEEAQRAWQEYNEPQPDISDGIIKP